MNEIIDLLQQTVAAIWDRSPYAHKMDGVEYKIHNEEPLTAEERSLFVEYERWNIQTLRSVVPGLIQKLVANNPNLLELIVGEHVLREAVRGKCVHKTLVFCDAEERFFSDVFIFPPKVETPEHSHNAYCTSFQLHGSMTEREREFISPGVERIKLVERSVGQSTVVSPYGEIDGSLDLHVISNDTDQPAASIHFYSQRIIGEDNIVKVNRSECKQGPSAVEKYFHRSGGELMLMA